MNDLVSIIVPVYKVEPYLKRCLDSILNQTYKNIEIILVDDGSPDNCPQICDEYAAKDNRIIVIHQENGGLSAARNVGTKKAKGDYIFYLDSDDSIEKDCIDVMVFSILKYPDVEIIVGEMKTFPPSNLYENKRIKSIDFIDNNLDVRLNFFKTRNRIPVNACNKLIKKDFILRNNLLFKPNLIHEDEIWMFHVALKANRISFIHKATYHRHINPNSITTSTSAKKRTSAWGIILKEMFEIISSPAAKQQLLYTLNLLRYYYNPKYEHKNYNEIWKNAFSQLKKHRLFLLNFLYHIYKYSYPLLKGHGIGFLIWIISND